MGTMQGIVTDKRRCARPKAARPGTKEPFGKLRVDEPSEGITFRKIRGPVVQGWRRPPGAEAVAQRQTCTPVDPICDCSPVAAPCQRVVT